MPETTDVPGPAAPAIELRGLRKAYGETKAVDGVDLRIERGEVVALLGPNGAGKSTTIDIILGLGRRTAARSACSAGRRPQAIPRLGGRDAADRRHHPAAHGARARHDDGLALPRPERRGGGAPPDRARRRRRPADAASSPVARRSGCASPSRWCADPDLMVLDEPTAALDVRRAPRLLGGDARVRRPGPDRGLRDPLPGGGRRVRRPHRADGGRAGRRRRVVDRDQVGGRPCARSAGTLPDVDPQPSSSGCPESRRPTGAATPWSSPAPSSDEALRALLPRYPDLRDIEVGAAASTRPSGSSPAAGPPTTTPNRTRQQRARCVDERRDVRAVRGHEDHAQPAVLHLLAGLPAASSTSST